MVFNWSQLLLAEVSCPGKSRDQNFQDLDTLKVQGTKSARSKQFQMSLHIFFYSLLGISQTGLMIVFYNRSLEVKTVESHTLAFLSLIILASAGVLCLKNTVINSKLRNSLIVPLYYEQQQNHIQRNRLTINGNSRMHNVEM